MRGETRFGDTIEEIYVFQSTPLMRGETEYRGYTGWVSGISIHSPHARGDLVWDKPVSYTHLTLPTIRLV